MKVLFEASHPAHVHFLKNTIWNLEDRGHEILIEARDKEVTLGLLDAYKLEYKLVGPHYKSLVKKACGLFKTDYKLLKIARDFKPDILVGRGSAYLAHLSVLTNKPYIAFVDTEHAKLMAWLTFPFTDVILTPSCFKKKINPKKHIKFDGYKELAYLHPNYFKPDPSVLDELGISRDDKFIILRFGSWSASHDTHSIGIKHGSELKFVKSLERYGDIFITSERVLPIPLQKYRLNLCPENIHSILSFAQLYVGEGETMAVESAILGTPAIDIEAITLHQDMVDITAIHGNADELVNKYKLMFAFSDQNQALEKAIELLEDNQLKKKWMKKREELLRDKIDVTAFMTEFIEEYPESFYKYCKNSSGENI